MSHDLTCDVTRPTHGRLPATSYPARPKPVSVSERKKVWKMAAKAYVVSMTVTELKEELKQRGLSTRGSKKSLRDRLEQVGVLKIAPAAMQSGVNFGPKFCVSKLRK